ncbi:MAG TPA: ABC transporter ATP-binding protein [Thermoleophilaceae bacterium]|nr:ABC transporter ATP-binding protein [Thermoleophilaceae bacterium]
MADDEQLAQVGAVTPVLHAKDLYRFYHAGDEETLALRGVSVDVEAGELVVVTGPSGSGKSTLLACLAGLDEPDGGSVWINGERISRQSEEERAAIRGRNIGLLFQQDNLVGHLTVERNVAIAATLAARRDGLSVNVLLASVGLAARARHLPHQLSGGEQARAGLAVAVAGGRRLILADEPTGELDDSTTVRIAGMLRDRANAGAAVLVVTHDEAVASTADRGLNLRDGVVTT